MTDVITIPWPLTAYDMSGDEVCTIPAELDLHTGLRPNSADPDGNYERFVESAVLRAEGKEIPHRLTAEDLRIVLHEWERENDDLQDLNRDILRRFGVRVESLA